MESDCVFCRIISGEMPCTKVYEDANILAFLDIAPVVRGHTLVIPKAHTESILDTPAGVLEKLIAVVQRIAVAQIRGLDADGVNVTQANGTIAGQVVPHIHFHAIPRFSNDGHSWNWRQLEYDDPAEMTVLAKRMREALVQ